MYPKISNVAKSEMDKYGTFNSVKVAELLQNLSQNIVSNEATGGASGATTNTMLMVAPCKMKITKAQAIVTTPSVGASNTPTIGIYNVTQSAVVAVSGAIALSGAAGDKKAVVIDATYETIAEGDVLAVQIVTPSATVTTALKAIVQVEWNSIA